MRRLFALLLAGVLMVAGPAPSHAIFGIGDIVLDPSNLAQNVLTASRTLQMIRNQIQQLANERQMLLDMARQGARLDQSFAGELARNLGEMQLLLSAARGISFRIENIERAYAQFYPEQYDAETVSRVRMVGDALERWRMSRASFAHSMKVQAEVVGAVERDSRRLETLMGYSGASVGQLQAAQAGNELLALSVKQQMQGQALMAAHYKTVTLENARRAMASEAARSRFTQFVSKRATYTRLN